jgi:hypothetical protein
VRTAAVLIASLVLGFDFGLLQPALEVLQQVIVHQALPLLSTAAIMPDLPPVPRKSLLDVTMT